MGTSTRVARGRLACAVIAGSLATTASSHAGLMVDLRITSVNGQPLAPAADPKDLIAAYGDIVTIDLVGVISGTNGINDEQIQAVQGSIRSGAGDLLGDLMGGVLAPFHNAGYQNGSHVDLDADGDIDIGAPNGSSGAAAIGYFYARSAFAQDGTTAIDAQSEERAIGRVNFAIGATGTDTFINFSRRTFATGANTTTAGVWFEDGIPRNPTTSPMSEGAPVHIHVPEPGALAAVGLTGLGLLARRQRSRAGAS